MKTDLPVARAVICPLSSREPDLSDMIKTSFMLPALGPLAVEKQKGRSIAQRHGKDYNCLHTKQKIKKEMVVISAACSFPRCTESMSLSPEVEKPLQQEAQQVTTEHKAMRQD